MPTGTSMVVSTRPAITSFGSHSARYPRATCSPGIQRAQRPMSDPRAGSLPACIRMLSRASDRVNGPWGSRAAVAPDEATVGARRREIRAAAVAAAGEATLGLAERRAVRGVHLRRNVAAARRHEVHDGAAIAVLPHRRRGIGDR